MAVSRSSGYGNLPNDNFIPQIYSQKVQKFFRRASVVEDITNTDYAGEIENFGDTVKIIKEPVVSVQAYTRGSVVNPQDLADDQITLVVDQASAFAFKVDDIEERHSHVNFESVATSSGAYALKNSYDANVLSNLFSNAGTTIGTDGSGQDIGFGTSEIDPLNLMANHSKRLNASDIPFENRWFVASPAFYEQLQQTDSKLLDTRFSGDANGVLRNGKVYEGNIGGFMLYMSNNLPASSTSNYEKVMSGHMSAASTANHIAKIEVVRDPDSFADVVRGLHVFGRKVLRTDALLAEHILID
jgi:hypothetical protein